MSQRRCARAATAGLLLGLLLTVSAVVDAAAACGTIVTVAGGGQTGIYGDGGAATQAWIHNPFGLTFGPDGNMYIAATYNHMIRKVDVHTGIISTVAGTGAFGFSGDGGPAIDALLSRPYQIAFGPDGDLYFTDTGNQRLRKIDLGSGVITTIAGNNTAGFLGDGGPASAASLGPAYGLTFGPSGDLYISDTGSNRVRRVDRITGIINAVAGSAAQEWELGDGKQATAAGLSIPFGIAFDPAGDLIISDTGHGRIRRVDRQTGTISTIAGITPREAHDPYWVVSTVAVEIPGSGFLVGDGGPASQAVLAKPRVVISDPVGNLYFADSTEARIWRIDRDTNTITSIAGLGYQGFSGDGGPAYRAALWNPMGLAFDSQGNLYVADSGNERIRRISPPFCSETSPPVPSYPF